MECLRKELAEQARGIEATMPRSPRFPRFIETPFGTGRVGPYAYQEASAVLAGEKPVNIFCENAMPKNLLDLLMTGVKTGFLSYRKVWEHNSHLFGHCYYFCQPDRQRDMDELIAMANQAQQKSQFLYAYPSGNGCYGYTVWDEIRIGEILGYTKADIAAFLEHVGYSSELYLDPSRREEAEREQVRMGNCILPHNETPLPPKP